MLAAVGRTVRHFFPQLNAWMGSLDDTRVQERCIYGRCFLTWVATMLFALKLGARRRLNFELNTAEALANLNRLAEAAQTTVPDHGTVNHFLGHVHPADMDRKLRRKLIHRLIRMRALDGGRLLGYYLIVLDGTGMLTFQRRHCPHCLTKTTSGGQTIYYHHVLEAKLVTPDGLALSIASEHIENADPKASKQDCELKAFARLAPRLKKTYPQLRICLLLDALYAKGPVMAVCRQYDWKYFITFKKGSLPALWREYQSLLELCPQNRLTHRPGDGRVQKFAWVEQLSHIDDCGREHRFAAIQCQETDGQGEQFFAWITNFAVRADNVARLANGGGRLRWKIENEGFNIQKNGGFALEHAYSYSDWQYKNFYLLMQVAHIILQLLEHGDLLALPARQLFGSLDALAKRLAEALRHCLIPPEALDPTIRVRISLNSS